MIHYVLLMVELSSKIAELKYPCFLHVGLMAAGYLFGTLRSVSLLERRFGKRGFSFCTSEEQPRFIWVINVKLISNSSGDLKSFFPIKQQWIVRVSPTHVRHRNEIL